MTGTPELVRQAIIGVQRHGERVLVIYAAVINDKPAEAGSSCPWAGHHNKGDCRGCRKV